MLPIDDLARMLRAVSDPARLRLLRLCFDQPTSVSELAAAVADSEPNVSRQLKQLATAGLLRRARRGQSVEYLPMIGGGFAAELALQLLARIDPVDPSAVLQLDQQALAGFPEGYRHLAYIQTRIGYKVKMDMPMLKGEGVQALYGRGRRWLQGGELER
jgi:DNA-binding transcriptional ArsR family regulator